MHCGGSLCARRPGWSAVLILADAPTAREWKVFCSGSGCGVFMDVCAFELTDVHRSLEGFCMRFIEVCGVGALCDGLLRHGPMRMLDGRVRGLGVSEWSSRPPMAQLSSGLQAAQCMRCILMELFVMHRLTSARPTRTLSPPTEPRITHRFALPTLYDRAVGASVQTRTAHQPGRRAPHTTAAVHGTRPLKPGTYLRTPEHIQHTSHPEPPESDASSST